MRTHTHARIEILGILHFVQNDKRAATRTYHPERSRASKALPCDTTSLCE